MFETVKARIGIYVVSFFLVASFWTMERYEFVSHSEMMLWIKFIIGMNILISIYLVGKWIGG